MQKLANLGNWVFGWGFIAAGLILLSKSALGGICTIAMGALLFPPIREFAFKKTQFSIPILIRGLLIIGLLFSQNYFTAQSEIRAINKEHQAMLEKRQEDIALKQAINERYFEEHQDEILNTVRKAVNDKQYKIALFHTNQYLSTGNSELHQLHDMAEQSLKIQIEAQELAKKEAEKLELTEQLKITKSDQVRLRFDIYSKLNNLEPNNADYILKYNEYAIKVKELDEIAKAAQEELARQRNEQIRRFGEEPTRSSWDNSYYEVEQYLKMIANDPDSIEIVGCGKALISANGWLVSCNYRGRNAFGARIQKKSVFTISNGHVLKVED